MGVDTSIEWTDHTFNPWWGCQRVSPACEHCYAETFSRRIGGSPWAKGEHWGPKSLRTIASEKQWGEPVRWNAAAEKAGVRARVFCASMADVFEDRRDLDAPRARLFALIEATPWLDWQLLTKRTDAMVRLAPERWAKAWPRNVWAGTTVESQKYADERIPHLLRVPAAVRFLSCEPLLEAVDLRRWFGYNPPHEINRADGDVRVRGGSGRTAVDRAGRDDLAGAPRPTASDREVAAANIQVPNCEGDAERSAGEHDGAPLGVQALLRTDSARTDRESQERDHDRQSPRELGTGDLRGTGASLDRGAWAETEGSARREERHGDLDREGGARDSSSAIGGREIEKHRGGLRSDGQASLQDRSWRPLGSSDLVIVGGESGAGARPFDIAWARSIVAQCRAAGVACFVKQLGAAPEWDGVAAAWKPAPPVHTIRDNGRGGFSLRLASKKGGDPSEWPADLIVREFPEVRDA